MYVKDNHKDYGKKKSSRNVIFIVFVFICIPPILIESGVSKVYIRINFIKIHSLVNVYKDVVTVIKKLSNKLRWKVLG